MAHKSNLGHVLNMWCGHELCKEHWESRVPSRAKLEGGWIGSESFAARGKWGRGITVVSEQMLRMTSGSMSEALWPGPEVCRDHKGELWAYCGWLEYHQNSPVRKLDCHARRCPPIHGSRQHCGNMKAICGSQYLFQIFLWNIYVLCC